MIKVEQLVKFYGSHRAVNDVSFHIEKGEVVGFLGPNGAGKSTIMNILTGYISSSGGNVEIDGFSILESPKKAKKKIGYLPEIPPLYLDMKVLEYLEFVYNLKKVSLPKKEHICEVMGLVGIEAVKNRLIKNLSKGYKQRIGLAQALIGNPDILILDEPTVGLDPKQIIEIRNLISRLGKNRTIILSSHILSEIQAVCKRVIIINQGEIVADDTLESLSRNMGEESELLLTAKGNPEDMLSAILNVNGVREAKLEICDEQIVNFAIKLNENLDIREDISRAVTNANGIILSFTSNKLTLEQIFLKLTEPIEIKEEREDEENESDINS